MANNANYYMVYGGVMEDLSTSEFENPDEIEVVGIFPTYDEAFKAWRGAAQRTVDNAEMRFFIVQVDHMQKVSEDPSKN